VDGASIRQPLGWMGLGTLAAAAACYSGTGSCMSCIIGITHKHAHSSNRLPSEAITPNPATAAAMQLRAMRCRDPTAKALVFSQFMTTIEWLKTRLTEEGFGYRFISGSMLLKQRAKVGRRAGLLAAPW
jgi:hypothetical protein